MSAVVEYVSLPLLIFVIGAVCFDLLARWIAFRRVESVAIGVALFSTLYSFLELLKNSGEIGRVWGIKSFIGALVLLALTGTHLWLKNELKEKIGKTFDKLRSEVSKDAEKVKFLNAQETIAKYAVEVTLATESQFRPGKRKRREEVVQAIKDAELDPSNVLTPADLTLGRQLRLAMLFVFAVLAMLAVLVVAYPAGPPPAP